MKYLKEELPCKFVKSTFNNVSGICISVFFFFFSKKAPYTAQVPVIRVFSSTQDLSDSTLSRQKTNYKTPSKLTVVSRSLSCLLCLGFLCSFPKRLDMSHNAQCYISDFKKMYVCKTWLL